MRPLYNLDKISLAAHQVWSQVPNAHFLFAVLPVAKDFDYERKVRGILGDAIASDFSKLSRTSAWPTITAWRKSQFPFEQRRHANVCAGITGL
jgi:hypothetical protein